MGIIAFFRIGRLIQRLLAAPDLTGAHTQADLGRLRRFSPRAVPRLINALRTPDEQRRDAVAALLAELLDDHTLPRYMAALNTTDEHVVRHIAAILRSSVRFDPNRLPPYLSDPDVPEAVLWDLLYAHKDRITPAQLLHQSTRIAKALQGPLFSLLKEIADEPLVPELLASASAESPSLRLNVTHLLAVFDRDDVQDTLHRLLGDEDQAVRLAALQAIRSRAQPFETGAVLRLLEDPEPAVREQAIDTIIERRQSDTFSRLLPLLIDDSERARSGAIRIMNALTNAKVLRAILLKLRMYDAAKWERAYDAIIREGDQKVYEAMLRLSEDEDVEIRRLAVEMLMQRRDDSTLDRLERALEDSDWWIRERAIDALAATDEERAIGFLIKALTQENNTRLAAIRALTKIGNPSVVDHLLPLLQEPDPSLQKQVLEALAQLTEEQRADTVVELIEEQSGLFSEEVQAVAHQAVRMIDRRQRDLDEPVIVATVPLLAPEARPSAPTDSSSERASPSSRLFNANTLPPGTVIADRFEFIKLIGRGAFGTVILVEDTLLREQVVLKIINPQHAADGTVIKRFLREIRFARKITHPNIIRLHDFIAIEDASAISMEYFPGHTLAQEIGNSTPLPWPRLRSIALQVIAGLEAAHEEGIVHRDMKPSNVLINDEGLVKIVDFGIAAGVGGGETRLTRTGMIVGTPAYLSPEQIGGKAVDNRADIYSFGVMLYEMAAGVPPYQGEDAMALLFQHMRGNPVPLHKANPAAPPILSAIVHKAMAVDPQKRYQSIGELQQYIERLPTA